MMAWSTLPRVEHLSNDGYCMNHHHHHHHKYYIFYSKSSCIIPDSQFPFSQFPFSRLTTPEKDGNLLKKASALWSMIKNSHLKEILNFISCRLSGGKLEQQRRSKFDVRKGNLFSSIFFGFWTCFLQTNHNVGRPAESSRTAQIPSRWCVLIYRSTDWDPKDPEYEFQFEEYMPAYTTFGAPASAICDRHTDLPYTYLESSAIITLKIHPTPRHYFVTFAPTINVHY